jgi:serine/threonine-protein kinase
VVASIIGAVMFLGVAGAGAWWWKVHRNPAAQPAPPAADVQPAQNVPEPAPPPAPVAETPVPPPAPADQILTNDDVVEMVRGKVPSTLILSQIRSSKTNFNLSAAEVIRLTKADVQESVIEGMRNPKRAGTISGPAISKSNLPPQQPVPAPAPPPVVVPVVTPPPQTLPPSTTTSTPAPQTVGLADGIPIPITLAEDIPTSADQGRPLRFTVSKDVSVGDIVVIAKGAAVTGEIVDGAKRKLFVSTKMTMLLSQADGVEGKKFKVRALPTRRTDGQNQRPVETGARQKSKDVAASAGAEYIAYIDGDQSITVHK